MKIGNLVGLVGWRGMVGSVLMDRMQTEGDFDLIEPVFFSTSNSGGKAPALAKNGGGAVVNIGSAAGLTNVPFFPTYSASKAALHSLTQAARMLLKAQGTSVFGVYAGPIDTDMVRELALPKTSARDVAHAILDGIEAGQEDIYPDPFAVEFGRLYQSSPKASERQNAAMVAGAAS